MLPGHRLEITFTDLPEGTRGEVIVVLSDRPVPPSISMPVLLETMPAGPSPRSYPTPEEYERLLQEKKAA